MAKPTKPRRFRLVHVGPAQYLNRAGILAKAGDLITPWGNRVLVSGGKRALAAAEEQLVSSLKKGGIPSRKHMFTGECSPGNIAQVKEKARAFNANVIIGVGGGKALDTAKAAAFEMGLPVVCIPTIAATCSATTALSIIYNDRGVFQRPQLQARNPSLVLVDPKIIANSPEIYLRAGILDSLAKWYEGRAVWPNVQDPDVQTRMAFQLAELLYRGHRQHAIDAVRLNVEHRVEHALIQTLDTVILLTGMVQSLAKGTLFTAIAHALHDAMTIIPGSRSVLHGLKVGYGIIVQLCVEKRPKREFEEVVSLFRHLGLEPSLKGLNLPFDRDLVLRVAEITAAHREMGPVSFPVNKLVIASAMEELERKFG
jgi:glycerol dehydrogenase